MYRAASKFAQPESSEISLFRGEVRALCVISSGVAAL